MANSERDDRLPAREYPAVWAYLLRLCWRHEPWRATMAVLVLVAGVFTFGASAVAVRLTIDSSDRGALATAIVAAAVAGLGYSVDLFVNVVGWRLQSDVAERVSLTVLDGEILRDINDIEGVEHLERPEYLDRLAMLAGSRSELMDSAWSLVHTICYAARLAVSLLLLGSVDPILLSLLLFAAAPVWLDNRASRAQTRAVRRTTEALRVEKHLFGLLTSAVPGKEIRVNGVAAQLVAIGEREWSRAHAERFRVALTVGCYRIAGWTIFIAGFGAALAAVIHDAASGHSTPGDVVLTISVAAAMRHTVGSTVERSTRTAGAARLIQPYLWLRHYADADRRRPRGTDPVPARLERGIDLENVVYRYPGAERNAVDGVSAHLPAGTVVALVGEYGSGKTTLVKLLTTLYRPQSGSIRIDGADLATLDSEAWRSELSAAFQDFGRYHTVLREVVGLGEPDAMTDVARIEAALAEADATDLVRRLPDGLDTRLGQQFGGVELSEGQWQKTALARSCMRTDPLLLLLDEPTASLDAPSEHAVFTHYMTRARALARHTGAVTVVVSHRFSTVADADLILVMNGGRLTEYGSHEELLERGGQYAALYGISAASYAGASSPSSEGGG
jgi:ABC-type multidrug transport system fused ATPase/permease subunit